MTDQQLQPILDKFDEIHQFISNTIYDHIDKKEVYIIYLKHLVKVNECGCALLSVHVFTIQSPRTDEWYGAYNMFMFIQSFIKEMSKK